MQIILLLGTFCHGDDVRQGRAESKEARYKGRLGKHGGTDRTFVITARTCRFA
nr:hypothetical protein BN993_02738 [Virgibacillus halodenitrificans]